jgi:sulfatase maturation enzyme AslB (radical SAM superfamily)
MNMNLMKYDKFKLTKYDFEKHLFVELVTTDICNQNCWYCHWKKDANDRTNGTLFKDRKPHTVSMENFYKVCDFIEMQDRETLEFNFYGGEPTMNPNLIPMILELDKRFGDKITAMTVLTNLTKPVEYFEPIMHIESLRLICSLHYNQKNLPSSEPWVYEEAKKAEKHIEKLNKLFKRVEEIRLVVTETNYTFIRMLYKCLDLTPEEEERFVFHVVDQLPFERAKELLSDFLDGQRIYKDTNISSHANSKHAEIISEGKRIDPTKVDCPSKFRGMLCSAGFVILSNGDVLKCWKDLDNRILLNVFEDELKKLPVWEMCRYEECSCDERFTKLSTKEFLKK